MNQFTTLSILMVDDDVRLLDAFRRQYRSSLQLRTATGGREGLDIIRQHGPFAVVVSDYQMPGMNGVTFLREVSAIAPDTVRIMLTGNADLQSAVSAVNEGHVFRFLTKPCSPEAFLLAVRQALELHQAKHAEQILLEETLKGSLEVMVELLGLANPSAFGKSSRLRRIAREVVKRLGMEDSWRCETAAMLSQIGCVAIPSDIIDRVAAGEQLPPEQARMLERHPHVACSLLEMIPRLEGVAQMIAHQRGQDLDRIGDPEVKRGAQILAAVLEYDELCSLGASRQQAVAGLRAGHPGWDPAVLDALQYTDTEIERNVVRTVPVRSLTVGMVLDADVVNAAGTVVVAKGFCLNAGTLERLRNFAHVGGVVEPVRVRVPSSTDTEGKSAA